MCTNIAPTIIAIRTLLFARGHDESLGVLSLLALVLFVQAATHSVLIDVELHIQTRLRIALDVVCYGVEHDVRRVEVVGLVRT